jgi:hypothetical protein
MRNEKYFSPFSISSQVVIVIVSLLCQYKHKSDDVLGQFSISQHPIIEQLIYLVKSENSNRSHARNCPFNSRQSIIQSLRNVYDMVKDEAIKAKALELIESETDTKYRKKYATL